MSDRPRRRRPGGPDPDGRPRRSRDEERPQRTGGRTRRDGQPRRRRPGAQRERPQPDEAPTEDEPVDEEPVDEEPAGDGSDAERADDDVADEEPPDADDEAEDEPAGDETDDAGADEEPEAREEPPPGRPQRLGARAVARAAVEQVVEMTGKSPEGVTSVSRSDDGWVVGVEVVETERIPDSADVLAIYEAELDGDAELMSYRRVRRYPRGRGDDE